MTYEKDGYLIVVSFPVMEIKSNSSCASITYSEEGEIVTQEFQTMTEMIRFSNWLSLNNVLIK